MKNKNTIIIGVLLLIVAAAVLYFFMNKKDNQVTTTTSTTSGLAGLNLGGLFGGLFGPKPKPAETTATSEAENYFNSEEEDFSMRGANLAANFNG